VYVGDNSQFLVGAPLGILPADDEIIFPISLEVGNAVDIYLQAAPGALFETESEAREKISNKMKDEQNLEWIINLSNGEQIVLEKPPIYPTSVDFNRVCEHR